jgi:hypothetical protein
MRDEKEQKKKPLTFDPIAPAAAASWSPSAAFHSAADPEKEEAEN